MGFNISSWPLARTVSMLKQQGTVSGVALERVVAEILRRGDHSGHLRRALATFPFPKISEQILKAFYVPEGQSSPTINTPVWSVKPSKLLQSLTVVANYAFVWLAKEGHDNPVNINYLTKIALPQMWALTGAILAKVDGVSMGAGIPIQIPDLMTSIQTGKEISYSAGHWHKRRLCDAF